MDLTTEIISLLDQLVEKTSATWFGSIVYWTTDLAPIFWTLC